MRLLWQDVPTTARDQVVARLGAPVVAERSQPGGFSPGVASRLALADGRRVFVKAVSAGRNPVSPGMHRREAAVLGYLPEPVPAPRLLHLLDDGDWVVLVIEDVEGTQPALPWRTDQLRQVLTGLERLAPALTPAPPQAPPLQETMKDDFTGWNAFAADPSRLDRFGPWPVTELDRLTALEARWPEAARGDTLLHADLRADNLLLTPAGEVVLVDWPHAAVGAAWCDVLFMMPSVLAAARPAGGLDPETLWAEFGPARSAARDDVDAVLAALTGYFLFHSTLPAPKNLTGLREFQAEQGVAALAWLRQRLERAGA
ncbi:phosphotransferase [Kineosporia sp. J2-2]|uniref:Phosphotransferase n=1 Tax=Kineosporia corallincola TaxID=2835133 RepID=A0ABS5TCP5_9ACTN|nr:phosphotransferase [Kineosporia corallincola]MBT0768852.1 phosphotransferase [Kineosporia corallincola]